MITYKHKNKNHRILDIIIDPQNKHKIKNNNDKRNPIYNLQTHKKGILNKGIII